jgi:putative transposase
MYPDRKREDLANRAFGYRRLGWNRMLTEKRIYLLLTRDALKNTPAHPQDQHPRPREVDVMSLCDVQLDLERSFANFFRNPGLSGSLAIRANAGTGPATRLT